MVKCCDFKAVRASTYAGKQLMRTETFIKVENDTSNSAVTFRAKTEQENAGKCIFLKRWLRIIPPSSMALQSFGPRPLFQFP
jgi:hypothetical protein